MPKVKDSSGKKTKSEKSKRQKEEAERKAREEEEARLRAEREDAERKERERLDAEELERLETEERKRRKGELSALEAVLSNNYNELYAEKLEARKNAKWARYMRCDGSPDPSNLCEINMHLTLWWEDKTNVNFEEILKDAELILQLIDELEHLLNDTMDPELTDGRKDQYKNTMLDLQALLQEKLDLGTHSLMLKATSMAVPDTNLIKIISNEAITVCLWANLTKNPRLKSFDFDSKGMVFELNPALSRLDCAIRALFTKFDHLSHQSKSYYPRVKAPEIEQVVPEFVISPEDAEKIEAPTEASSMLQKPQQQQPKQVVISPAPSGASYRKVDSTLQLPDSDSEVETKVINLKSEESVEEDVIEEDIPIPTPVPLDYDDFDGDEDVVDLRGFHVVGGVFHLSLCEMPPQPKIINSWQITVLVDPPELHHINYVGEKEQKISVPKTENNKTSRKHKKTEQKITEQKTPEQVIPEQMTSEQKTPEQMTSELKTSEPKAAEELTDRNDSGSKEAASDVDKKEKDIAQTPIMVTLRLPEDVCFCEEPQVARWDYTEKVWKTNGFIDKIYNEAGRQLTFRMCRFGTMALLQDAHVNMPFQSWELRPRAANQAQLTIIAAILEVELQIKDELVCLSQPVNKPELSHLIDKWMSLQDLVKKMCQSGLNIFPAEDSFKYVKIPDKNPVMEDRLYRQMSLVSSAMAFSWSRWNMDVDERDKIIIQGAEHMNDEPLVEDDWSLFQITKRRIMKLKMTEFSENFSSEHAEGTEFHADLYHMTFDILSGLARERILETNAAFSETVYNLLRMTRVITYS